MLTVALLASGLVGLVIISVVVWRGDGRTDLRRCPECWYDMGATEGLTCPECGHTATSGWQLHQRRRVGRAMRAGLGAAWVAWVLGAYFALPGPWTSKVPRPLMRVMLSVAAAPPRAPAGGAGSGLPVPDGALRRSGSAWERKVWEHQAMVAMDAWAEAVTGGGGAGPLTDEELVKLVPLARDANALFQQTGDLRWGEAWVYQDARQRLVERRRAAAGEGMEGAALLLRLEWALGELQHDGTGYAWRPDFARVPDEVITRALGHADAQVRLFGVQRFGRRVHLTVMDGAQPMPVGRERIEAMAKDDPDPAVRRRAADLVAYLEGFVPRR